MKRIAPLIALLLLALTPSQEARLPKVKVFIAYKEQIKELWEFLTKNPDIYQVLDLRVGIAYIPTDLQKLIKNWVKSGKGIIVYAGSDEETDSASIFFNNQIEYATLNRWEPIVLKAFPSSNHPLLKGVTQVKFYMYRIPDIKNLSGKIPLLARKDQKVVSFAFQYGKGRGVYLPTGVLLPFFPQNQYDNKRFFINIYQWLAGNSVPD